MLHQFDHRFATYEGSVDDEDAETRPVTLEEKRDPNYRVRPRYWVERDAVIAKVARVPSPLLSLVKAQDHPGIRRMLLDWLGGHCLNRGDAGDVAKAKLGEEIVQARAGSLFASLQSDAIDYITKQAGYRAMEREFPLTDSEAVCIADAFATEDAAKKEVMLLETAAMLVECRIPKWLIGFRNNARNTDVRTGIFTILPLSGVGNSSPLIDFSESDAKKSAIFLANLNSLVQDFIMRQKVGGPNLNFFYIKQLAVLPPQAYEKDDFEYIGSRVLELVYTSWEMQDFAIQMGFDGPPFVWDEDRRALLKAELDAYFARLYGLTRKQLRYILDPNGLSDAELINILDPEEDPTCSGPHLLPAEPTTTFPGETFRVLKQNDEKEFGEYRTRRLVLEAWARLEVEFGPVVPRDYHELLPPPVVPVAGTVTSRKPNSQRGRPKKSLSEQDQTLKMGIEP
ncbi:hypothetical protein [Armatimonas rosea]|uniref:Uncharacterized protein n=1 Tax=Armatimonas rosea TaxID=685828 RepID=A0A7W9W8T4_ARMRO|nr:hypothetical protein [Armatimonas rosea]MBB6053899.1 hypothetical protein [Armatimonas rosea]